MTETQEAPQQAAEATAPPSPGRALWDTVRALHPDGENFVPWDELAPDVLVAIETGAQAAIRTAPKRAVHDAIFRMTTNGVETVTAELNSRRERMSDLAAEWDKRAASARKRAADATGYAADSIETIAETLVHCATGLRRAAGLEES